MSGSSLLAIALRDTENDNGADAKAKLREQLAKGNLQNQEGTENNNEADPPNEEENEEDGEGEEDEKDEEDDTLS